MGATRMIATDLWQDQVWRRNIKDLKVRYLWLYLLTCTMSKTCGIYHLPLELASMETRLSEEELKKCLNVLIDNKMCVYSEETEEIAITNFPKYNVRNVGRPMIDCLLKELSLIKNRELIKIIIDGLYKYELSITDNSKKVIIHSMIEIYISVYKGENYTKEKGLSTNTTNTNTNTTTNKRYVNDTLNDTYNDTPNDIDDFLTSIGWEK